MDVTAVVLVIAQWVHTLAAAFWVGGGLAYLLVIRPANRRRDALPQAQNGLSQAQDGPSTGSGRTEGQGDPLRRGPERAEGLADEFRGLVTTAIAVLLLTGAILSVARLTGDAASIAYAVVLGVKIALALYMFYVVRLVRRGDYGEQQDGGGGVLRRTARRTRSRRFSDTRASTALPPRGPTR